jgi:predicted alpha/beta-hydrolase family hydrolase
LAFKPDIDVLSLPEHVRLHWFEHSDHDFKTLKRSGVTQQLLQKMAAVAADFIRQESHQDQF